jgi:hypothetical protein
MELHGEQFIEIDRSRKTLHLVHCTLDIYLRCTDIQTSNKFPELLEGLIIAYTLKWIKFQPHKQR